MQSDKQFEVLKRASSYLRDNEREVNIAEILLQHHLNVSRTTFFMEMQQRIPEEIQARFKHDLKQHALFGVPVQHLTGSQYFYGREFSVNKHVLVPRFETEELVQHVIEVVRSDFGDQNVTIVDVGTGSGVIGTTLALELSNAHVYATDISEEALHIARKNARTLGAGVIFLQGDFLQPIIEENINPQIIVSNPPYIKLKDEVTLADTVVNYDPHLALFGGDDGLDAYRKIMNQLSELPEVDDRSVLFEIGYEQADEVSELAKMAFPESRITTLKDINRNDRIISIRL